MMKKSLLEIYALAVCFATIVCFIVSLGVGIYDIVEVIYPEFTMSSYEYEKHQTNDAFWDKESCGDKQKIRPPENELTKQREESYHRAINSEKRNAFQSIIQIVIVLIVNAIVFIIHWKIAKHARESNVNIA